MAANKMTEELTMATIDLKRLLEPFPLDDIEWRVSRSGNGPKGIFCLVLAYITARGVQSRLDEVCGPEKWKLEPPVVIDVNGKSAFACGISMRIGDEWITKWDVAEPTAIEPAKGGWSGAVKRAACAWGIGRYLYALDETFAEVSEQQVGRDWNYARLSEKHGGSVFYWKSPGLPAWALPREPEHEVSESQLGELKKAWRGKFAADCRNPKELREGFQRFVHSLCGDFPIEDHSCWLLDSWEKCMTQIQDTSDPDGPAADVPFEG